MRRTDDLTRGLYPFLEEETRPAASDEQVRALLDEVRRSTRRKARDVSELRAALLAEYASEIARAGAALAAAFTRGGTLLAFGNGGSATDAADAARDLLDPPVRAWRSLPAVALTDEGAVLSAIANDVGVENVFVRQIIAYGRPGDVALGFSTSGSSANVVAGMEQARRRGMLTVALSGSGGGRLAEDGAVDFCFVARADHVPRIQEGHATLWHALLETMQCALATRGEPEVPAA